jgi:hypothetical protein
MNHAMKMYAAAQCTTARIHYLSCRLKECFISTVAMRLIILVMVITVGREEWCIQGIGGEIRGKEDTWKIQT